MNAHAPIIEQPEAETSTEVVVIERETALAVLTDPDRFDAFYTRVKAQTDAFVPDLSTAKSRKAIASMARKVVNTKTAIVDAAKELTEEWRSNVAKVNAARGPIVERLDALRDEVRKPLTDWEKAEEKREAAVKLALERLHGAAVVSIEDTPATVQARLAEVEEILITDEGFQEYAAAARATQEATLATLSAAVLRLTREAEERAELDRLRAANAERLAKEEADRVAAEQAEREATEAREREEREAEEKRQADARAAQAKKDEEERVAAATRKAEEDARAEEQRKADEARQEQERAHQAGLDKERRQREAAEAEAKRLADAETERLRQEEEQRLAAQRRTEDRDHRGVVMGEAKAAIMALGGVKEDVAKKIVLAIVADEIPHVAISF